MADICPIKETLPTLNWRRRIFQFARKTWLVLCVGKFSTKAEYTKPKTKDEGTSVIVKRFIHLCAIKTKLDSECEVIDHKCCLKPRDQLLTPPPFTPPSTMKDFEFQNDQPVEDRTSWKIHKHILLIPSYLCCPSLTKKTSRYNICTSLAKQVFQNTSHQLFQNTSHHWTNESSCS